MTNERGAELLKAMFPQHERQFLLSHPKFKKALKLATDECLFDLGHYGFKILREHSAVKVDRRQAKAAIPIRQSLCVAFALATGLGYQTCRVKEVTALMDDREIPLSAGFETNDRTPRMHWA